MIAVVSLVLKTGDRETVEVTIRAVPQRTVLNRIDNEIEKVYGKRDDWERWELQDVKP